jgi:hypothetical protein
MYGQSFNSLSCVVWNVWLFLRHESESLNKGGTLF